MKEDIKLAKDEIVELKTNVKTLRQINLRQADNHQKYIKELEKDFNERLRLLKDDNERMSNDMAQLQEENVLMKEEKKAEQEKSNNIQILKKFPGFRKTVITTTGRDECINDIKCMGDCSHTTEH